ncbi:putative MFS family arabinose efflux permease [Paraburkholderia sp. BL23I1N1]|uniref:MFS transporter n=1 Tax=Paraburkholderia sp. BL23I1N1 TaxID=1938802 RepID=UPI000FF41CC1|nr:MFS transporter [Paraburkholderia sp. BL23I1N1]RKE39002.1 putative MFS family arabinose efflux permease [Paraburkholderia sp. BL23I1N1]
MSDGVQQQLHEPGTDSVASSIDYGWWALTFSYVLSQFFRSYIAVISTQLIGDFHFSPQMFGWFAGSFFLVFAIAQLPVGIMFDRYGVRGPTALLMGIGAACAGILSMTTSATVALAAQAGIGLGCAPIFMGLLNYVLRTGHGTRNVRAITTASAIGMAGALLAALPLSRATASFGWRPVMVTAALAMLCATLGVLCFVRRRDAAAHEKSLAAPQHAAGAVKRCTRFWTLMPACLALSVGSTFRTSWGGPYLADVYGFDVLARGNAMTVTSVIGIAASFCIPVAVRFCAPKLISLLWLIAGVLAALALALSPDGNWVVSVALICVLFSVGSIHPLVMSQARAIISPRRLGIGLGLLNSLVFLGVALTSSCFGWIAGAAKQAHFSHAGIYSALFAVTVVPLAIGAAVYFFSPVVAAPQEEV